MGLKGTLVHAIPGGDGEECLSSQAESQRDKTAWQKLLPLFMPSGDHFGTLNHVFGGDQFNREDRPSWEPWVLRRLKSVFPGLANCSAACVWVGFRERRAPRCDLQFCTRATCHARCRNLGLHRSGAIYAPGHSPAFGRVVSMTAQNQRTGVKKKRAAPARPAPWQASVNRKAESVAAKELVAAIEESNMSAAIKAGLLKQLVADMAARELEGRRMYLQGAKDATNLRAHPQTSKAAAKQRFLMQKGTRASASALGAIEAVRCHRASPHPPVSPRPADEREYVYCV